MPSGGARGRSGPAPSRNALRRDRDGREWIELPPEGRSGEPPEWPLIKPTQRELAMWSREWARPQAVMWEAHGLELQVALYIRTLREAEAFGTKAATRTELRRQMDDLGLTTYGLAKNRWAIAEDPAQAPASRRAAAPRSIKERMQVIAGGGGA